MYNFINSHGSTATSFLFLVSDRLLWQQVLSANKTAAAVKVLVEKAGPLADTVEAFLLSQQSGLGDLSVVKASIQSMDQADLFGLLAKLKESGQVTEGPGARLSAAMDKFEEWAQTMLHDDAAFSAAVTDIANMAAATCPATGDFTTMFDDKSSGFAFKMPAGVNQHFLLRCSLVEASAYTSCNVHKPKTHSHTRTSTSTIQFNPPVLYCVLQSLLLWHEGGVAFKFVRQACIYLSCDLSFVFVIPAILFAIARLRICRLHCEASCFEEDLWLPSRVCDSHVCLGVSCRLRQIEEDSGM